MPLSRQHYVNHTYGMVWYGMCETHGVGCSVVGLDNQEWAVSDKELVRVHTSK